jgi:uncharacterized SAM-binding protein YcdF (DUF218 family)
MVFRRSRRGRAAALAGAIGIFLWTWPPFSVLLSTTLEGRYPVRPFPPGDAQAIVVLSGAVFQSNPVPELLPGVTTYVRCSYAAWLYRHWKPLPVVATGGMPMDGIAIADVMRQVLQARGVPDSGITTERFSRSTRENAAFTAAILLPRGIRTIALVTDAFHMPRAERAFRKAGFVVVPAPCGFRKSAFDTIGSLLLPDARAALYNDEALHEWVGLLWYKLSGAI